MFYGFRERDGILRAYEELSAPAEVWVLQTRYINHRRISIAEINQPGTARHTHDLQILEFRLHAKANAPAGYTIGSYQAPGKSAVDDCGAWMLFVIRPIKVAAGSKRDSERLEETGRDDGQSRQQVVARGRSSSNGRNR